MSRVAAVYFLSEMPGGFAGDFNSRVYMFFCTYYNISIVKLGVKKDHLSSKADQLLHAVWKSNHYDPVLSSISGFFDLFFEQADHQDRGSTDRILDALG